MHYLALATDYDGTLAHDGVVDDPTIAALQRLREAGRRIILVTGRELDDLQRVMPRLDLFDRVVAENGALLYRPHSREERPLAEPPPPALVARLRAEGVTPLSVGRAIVATWEPNETAVLAAIRDLGLGVQITFNKGAVMVLPSGIDKASGLRAALDELGLSPRNCVGVGDAENDLAFVTACGATVAVANALPSLKARAALVTEAARGAGVAELIGRMLDNDLADLDGAAPERLVQLAEGEGGQPDLLFAPHRETLLLFGASGGGKSTLTGGLLERLTEAGFQWCVIDPEGDYEGIEDAVGVGDGNFPPSIDRVLELLRRPGNNVVVNLLALPVADRPAFLAGLLPDIQALKGATGRPHLTLVDEAHHMLPETADPGAVLPGDLSGFLFVTVHPDRLARPVLHAVSRILVVGRDPGESLAVFCQARGLHCPPPHVDLQTGEVLTQGVAVGAPLQKLRVVPGTSARRRHRRKYAEGRLGEDTSFYFRGPGDRLNLRAHNLTLFVTIGDGVDLDTWEHHRQRGDYARWLRDCIKDRELADAVAAIERDAAPTQQARAAVKAAIEARYTLPA